MREGTPVGKRELTTLRTTQVLIISANRHHVFCANSEDLSLRFSEHGSLDVVSFLYFNFRVFISKHGVIEYARSIFLFAIIL